MLHGFTGSGLDFDGLAQHMPGRIWAPDIIGHGNSPAPRSVAPYSMEAVIDQLEDWRKTHLHEHFHLVGYSMGGRVALHWIAHAPEQIRSLTLISANPGLADPTDRTLRQKADHHLADHIEEIGTARFASEWSKHPLIRTQSKAPAAFRSAMETRRSQNKTWGLANSLRAMGTGTMPSMWGHLSAINTPTLIMVGEQDHKYADIGAACHQAMGNSQIVVMKDVGHAPHIESPAPAGKQITLFHSKLVR